MLQQLVVFALLDDMAVLHNQNRVRLADARRSVIFHSFWLILSGNGCFNKPEDAPFGIGHEMSGVIERLGKNATAKGLKVGDRVGGKFLQ